MLTVLLTSCGAQTSPSIIKALRENGEEEVKIIGVDVNKDVCGNYLSELFYTARSSITDPIGFCEDIDNIASFEEVDVIYPCGNEDVMNLAINKELYECPIVANEYHTMRLAFDKLYVYSKAYEIIPNHAPYYGQYFNRGNRWVIKPRFGRGGRGVYIIDKEYRIDLSKKPSNVMNPKMVEDNIDKSTGDYIIMEYLPGKIYSVYCLCDKGKTLWTGINERIYGNASNTLTGITVNNPEIEEAVIKMNKEFEFNYSVNYEFGEDVNGVPKLFDLNPRSAASTGVFVNQGINLPWLTVKQALGMPLGDIPKAKEGSMFIRYLEEVYV